MALAYQEHYTVEDYQLWEGDWELIYGAPYAMSPSPTVSHQRVETRLVVQLSSNLNACKGCEVLSELDWYVLSDTVVKPDILVACNLTGEKLTKTPEAIFEIVSDSSSKRDESIKFELYQQEGVAFYFLVYPKDQKVKAYRWENGNYIKQGDYSLEALPFQIKDCQISLNLADIW